MFAGTKGLISEKEFLEVFMNATVLTERYFYTNPGILPKYEGMQSKHKHVNPLRSYILIN
jgi:hypothetical protein